MRVFIIRIAKFFIINVYMPCRGTADREVIINNLLTDLTRYIENYNEHKCIIADDSSCNLDTENAFTKLFNDICLHNLSRCDIALSCSVDYTFHNESRGCYIEQSIIIMFSSDVNS